MAAFSFSNITLLSFSQWFTNRLQQDGQAYFNTSSRLYYQPDTRLPAGYVAYASPFRSWVYDSGVSGAVIADRISGSLGIGGTGAVLRGQSGLQIDYTNGRVILPSTVGTNAVISGSYAVTELNTYFGNQSAERMVFTDKYYLNSRFNRPITGIPPANDMVTPCVFVTNLGGENDNWAFGGLYNTKMDVRLIVMAETLNQLEGTLSLATDAMDANFPQLPPYLWPLNPLGDVKSGYNYQTVKEQYGQPGNLYMITDVTATKVGDGVKIDESVFVGLIDLKIERPRSIH